MLFLCRSTRCLSSRNMCASSTSITAPHSSANRNHLESLCSTVVSSCPISPLVNEISGRQAASAMHSTVFVHGGNRLAQHMLACERCTNISFPSTGSAVKKRNKTGALLAGEFCSPMRGNVVLDVCAVDGIFSRMPVGECPYHGFCPRVEEKLIDRVLLELHRLAPSYIARHCPTESALQFFLSCIISWVPWRLSVPQAKAFRSKPAISGGVNIKKRGLTFSGCSGCNCSASESIMSDWIGRLS